MSKSFNYTKEEYDKLPILLGTIFVFSALFVVILMLFSFIIGIYLIFFTREGSISGRSLINIFHIFIAGLPIPISIPIRVYMLFTLSWIIYLIFFIIALNNPINLIKVVKEVYREGPKRILNNAILTITSIFTVLVVTTIILQYLQERSGIPTGTIPERDPIMMFVSISIAPLVEEIGFRLSFIGLIAAYLAFMADGRLRSILYALWHPKGCLDKLIVKKNKTSKEVGILNVMVILSGIIFGLAHITYGAGWEVGKLSQATLAGIALGWLYINYGFHAAVLLHWAFNYFTSAYYYLNKVLKILYVTDLANISVIITGFLGYLIIVFMIFKRLRR